VLITAATFATVFDFFPAVAPFLTPVERPFADQTYFVRKLRFFHAK